MRASEQGDSPSPEHARGGPYRPQHSIQRGGVRIDPPRPASASNEVQRAHLARAHHEICTALTVFTSNMELVRIELRDFVSDETIIPVRAHLDELEWAVDRLRGIAREMKVWHDDATTPPGEVTTSETGDLTAPATPAGPRAAVKAEDT